MKLTAREIYKELRLRGYDYGKTFQGILESNYAGKVNLWVHKQILFFNFVWITFVLFTLLLVMKITPLICRKNAVIKLQ